MFQSGKQKSTTNKKNTLEKVIGKTIDQDSTLIAAAYNLAEAQKLAKKTQNIEAYLAISDRWINISEILSSEKSESYGRIGFTADLETENYNEQPEGPNKGKGKPKIRKKSR